MRPDPPPKADPAVLLARLRAQRNRRNPWPGILVILAGLVALGTLLLWLIWPDPLPRRAFLVAYDAVALADEPAALHALLEPLDEDERGMELPGQPLVFNILGGDQTAEASTDRSGSARVEHAFAAADGPWNYQVNYPGVPDRLRGAEATAQVFVLPADARLLVVDADSALGDLTLERLQKSLPAEIVRLADVAPALEKLKDRYQIVYATALGDRAQEYARMYNWLHFGGGLAGALVLPNGPLLSAARHGDPATDWTPVLVHLKGRFREVVTVTRRRETAAAAQATGLRTVLIGEAADPPEGITAAATWPDAASVLLKEPALAPTR